ncbi:twin arginine-targeting protein translocase TatB [Candidatus Williamhamiltonella defendens]|uniref:Twin arginine-targeting protein translocase TatB n=1 Tax=Candidatus Williamhamiltonella defendens TaxID=138072 RepID=A0A2D3T8X8_9ENTR|nr:twin arginine-targeting protein translocase TatB [Candidatus Hamiltonella defensa]ATW32174.1 twin arginine-targeting protein translocase TatB [Candidatus Hamiltonella defensa]AYB49360.1 twin-arginine translocase subunit TatB [Candidatus Hamiltonella defensa]
MFDIGFSELLLVIVLTLLVLGPKKLPIVVKTVTRWIRILRSFSETIQNDLSKEFRLEELEEDEPKHLKKSRRS